MAPHRRLRKFQNIIKIRGPGISKTKKIEVRLCCSAESRSRISSITRSGSDDSLHVSGPNNVDRSRSDEKAEEIESRKDVDVVMDGAAELTDYRKRKLREEKSWDDKRGVLQVAFMKQQFLPTNANCISCIENGSASPRKAVCRCQDCGCQQLLCLQCASARHNNYNIFHVLEIWKDGKFVPMFVNNFVIFAPGHENCGSVTDIKSMVFVDMQGRQHLKKIMFCKCQTEAEALISLGFWPGSAEKPVSAFDTRLLDMLSDLLFECQCSLDKLCATIDLWKGPLLPTHVKNIYKVLNSGSFAEYRFFKHSIRLQAEKCTLCPKPNNKGVLIEIMDACFGFVRKKSAGLSLNAPKYEMCMFGDQADVDNFVLNHARDVNKSDNSCSQYRAGEITECIRSKGRNEKYDEKAVFGRICRHGFPKGFISLKHGERIAYAVYELKRMIEPYSESDNVEIKCMYDIACILHKHLKNNNCYDLEKHLEKIQFGIPIFHSYVHVNQCQVAYSPRRVAGFGLTDGEGIERLWSYLRKFCYMTKEMTASNRTDLLTEALLHYARRINQRQGTYLKKNLKKARLLKEKTEDDLQQSYSSISSKVKITSSVLAEWKEAELRRLLPKPVAQRSTMSWELQYAQLLWDHFQLRNSIASTNENDMENNPKDLINKANKLDEKLKVMEKKNGITKRWKHSNPRFVSAFKAIEMERRESFLEKLHALSVERHLQLMLKERYSTGQKQAARLARQVNQQTKKIKIELARYNARLSLIKEHIEIPQKPVTFMVAKDPNSDLYSNLVDVEKPNEEIPFCIRRRIIQLSELLKRCDEEEALLRKECKTLLASKLENIDKIQQRANDLACREDAYSKGLSAWLSSHVMQIQKEIEADKQTFQLYEIEIPSRIQSMECGYLANLLYETAFDESDDEPALADTDSDSEFELTLED